MFRIFIGWDSRFPEAGRVLAHTLRKNSSIPLDIRFLDYRHLHDCYGFERTPDPLASTEFSYSRFLVPWLCDYTGIALFLDNDMVCFGDVAEIAALPRTGPALWVVKHDHQPTAGTKFGDSGVVQTSYPRKNWSSMMLMDCAKLRLWTKHAVETATGAYLHRFQDIPDEAIGELPKGWNVLTDPEEGMKLLHYTEGGPWYAGCENCPGAELWRRERQAWLVESHLDPANHPLVPIKL